MWSAGTPSEPAAEVTAFPLSTGADRHPELQNRLSLSIDCGAATVHLRPTAAEARALIEMLEWAIHASEVPA